MAKRRKTKRRKKRSTIPKKSGVPRCGLCGKTGKLTKTDCCNQWICDDSDQYIIFSYARNSCHRNHDRYTLCSLHYDKDHSGNWQECKTCIDELDTERYVYYGTNEYNFTKLKNPPSYEPSRCTKCNTIIVFGEDGYSIRDGKKYCEKCMGY